MLALRLTTILVGLIALVLSQSVKAGGYICPIDPPGVAMSSGQVALLGEVDRYQQSVRNGTCRTASGLDCALVNWSSGQAARYPHCAGFFFDAMGNEGPLGKLISGNIKKDIELNKSRGAVSPFLRGYSDLEDPKVCPGFATMNEDQKVFFWGWFFEILGYFESGCNPKKENWAGDVPHKPAVGLYQMEEAKSLRSWRGPSCQVSAAAIHTAEGNTACALDIMRSSMNNKNQVFGGPNGSSYWYALNQNAKHDEMTEYLGRFPLCKPVGGPTQEDEYFGGGGASRSRSRGSTRRNTSRRSTRRTTRRRSATQPAKK